LNPIVRLDFGNDFTPAAPGFTKVGRVYRSPRYLWIDELREVWRPNVEDPLLLSSIQGQEGEFRVGLSAGTYTLRFTFCDPAEAHGPFDVAAAQVEARAPKGFGEAATILSGIVVPQGEVVCREAQVAHGGGALALRFAAVEGRTFLINGLEIEGPDSAEAQVLFPDAPADRLPAIPEVLAAGRDDPAQALREVSQWLLEHRHADGFLGDQEGTNRWWYTSAFPIRTFLAAYELLGGAQYIEATQAILDRLVTEQMPSGAFTQVYRNQPTSTLTPADFEALRARYWMNMADIGSIVAALAAACRYVSGERRERYLTAVRRYCDGWARQFQQPSGGFTNGWLAGRYGTVLYGVATANSAQVFTFFASVAGEPDYLAVAERAIDFLIDDWNEDGLPHAWPGDGQIPDHWYYQPVNYFGDQFYVLDGIASTAYHSRNRAFRQRVFAAMHKYLFGARGLLAIRQGQAWWPLQDHWDNSKSAGMPIFLQQFLQQGPQLGATVKELQTVDEAYALCRRFLCTPRFARLIGVMSEDPDLPWGRHNLQTWTGSAIAATGFAGMAIANMVRPGVTLLG
jgi:hypothetical protein